uniref:Uncharacterized protein n=1 Tax=Romanomermis culicivorax TaxID=13658 RepID=A0A915IA40_ROMCU
MGQKLWQEHAIDLRPQHQQLAVEGLNHCTSGPELSAKVRAKEPWQVLSFIYFLESNDMHTLVDYIFRILVV